MKILSFFKGALLTYLTQIFVFIIAGIVSILTARYFGPSGVGIFSYLTFILALSAQIGIIGLTSANVYFLGQKKYEPRAIFQLSFLYSAIIGAMISFFIYGLALLYPTIILVNIEMTILLITILAIPFLFFLTLLQSIYLGLKQYFLYNSIPFLTAIISLGVILLIYYCELGIVEKIIGSTLCSILLATGYYLLFRDRMIQTTGISNEHEIDIKDFFSFGSKAYICCLFGFLTIQLNIYFINFLLGSTSLGYYSAAYTLAYTLFLFPSSIGSILFSKVSSGSPSEFTQKIFRISFMVMTVFGIGLFFFSNELILILFGEQFSPASSIIGIMIPAIIILGLSSVLNQDLAGRGFPLILIIAPIISLFSEIVLSFILIQKMDIVGASLSLLITFIVMFGIILWYYKKNYSCSYSDMFIIKKADIYDLKNALSTIIINK